MPATWKTLFLPKNFPKSQVLRNYVFGHNETHMGLVLDYGSVLNHHESANVKPAAVPGSNNVHFQVRMGFQYANRNALKICSIHAHITHTQQRHEHINTFKATKDIAAGQEILVRYGSAKWFEVKNIPYLDVDYASTMWRPDLHPLPCRQRVGKITGADGRHTFAVLEAVPSGTVLEISLCVEVSVIVVDQFPFLWDFVLSGEMKYEYIGCLLQTDFCLLTRTHRLCFLQIKAKEISENVLNGFSIFISPLTLFQYPQTSNHRKPSRPYDLGLGLGSFICMDMKHEYMHRSNQYRPEA